MQTGFNYSCFLVELTEIKTAKQFEVTRAGVTAQPLTN